MPTVELLAEIELLKARAERAEAELAAMKNDARSLVGTLKERIRTDVLDDDEIDVIARILAATKEGTDADD